MNVFQKRSHFRTQLLRKLKYENMPTIWTNVAKMDKITATPVERRYLINQFTNHFLLQSACWFSLYIKRPAPNRKTTTIKQLHWGFTIFFFRFTIHFHVMFQQYEFLLRWCLHGKIQIWQKEKSCLKSLVFWPFYNDDTFCKLAKIYTVLKQKLALFHDNDDDDFIWIEFLVSQSWKVIYFSYVPFQVTDLQAK